ncbi:MAG: hypothetical protein CL760_10355 [Chloroflexi bacterium]|nr:hypothetical protein [Chloroflexota bacterium]|tara:strand:+ start:5773 stop:5982 length:210 start_codon:yes stop_codon:yes gene_type:complete
MSNKEMDDFERKILERTLGVKNDNLLKKDTSKTLFEKEQDWQMVLNKIADDEDKKRANQEIDSKNLGND